MSYYYQDNSRYAEEDEYAPPSKERPRPPRVSTDRHTSRHKSVVARNQAQHPVGTPSPALQRKESSAYAAMPPAQKMGRSPRQAPPHNMTYKEDEVLNDRSWGGEEEEDYDEEEEVLTQRRMPRPPAMPSRGQSSAMRAIDLPMQQSGRTRYAQEYHAPQQYNARPQERVIAQGPPVSRDDQELYGEPPKVLFMVVYGAFVVSNLIVLLVNIGFLPK